MDVLHKRHCGHEYGNLSSLHNSSSTRNMGTLRTPAHVWRYKKGIHTTEIVVVSKPGPSPIYPSYTLIF